MRDPKPRRTRLIASFLMATLVLTAAAAPVLAGKGGGGGGGKGKPTPMTATVVVAPSPVSSYSTFWLSGCGYKPNSGVQFNLYAPGVTAVWGGVVDGSGCLVNATGWANAPGNATLDVLQDSRTKVATTTFTIN